MQHLRTVPMWRAYAVALGLTLLAAGVVSLLTPSTGAIAASLFVLPVAAGAWLGGLGPGTMAMLVSIGASALLVFPPIGAASLFDPGVRSVIIFAIVLALLTAMLARAHDAERLARQQARRWEAEQHERLAAERAADVARRGQALAQALAGARSVEAVAAALAADALPLLGAESGALAVWSQAGAELEVMIVAAGSAPPTGRSTMALDAPLPLAEAARTARPIWLPSPEAVRARFPALLPDPGADWGGALAAVPLLQNSHVVGSLMLQLGQAGDIDASLRQSIMSVGQQSGLAVNRVCILAAETAGRLAAEREREHAEYLADVSTSLGGSLSLPSTLQTVARLALRRAADFCLVYALGSDGVPHGAAWAHRDPQLEPRLGEVSRLLQNMPGQRAVVVELLRSGRPLLVPELSHSMLAALPADSGLRRLIGDLQPRSMMVVPLAVESRAVGLMVLCSCQAGRPYGAEAEAQAQELAAPAALAVDNALRHAVAQALNVALEESVNERTEELQATIAKLEAENAERERAQAQLELSREQLRSLSARLQAAREEERARIAKEVHDELGQQLTSLKMDIGWLRKKLREQQEPLLRKSKAMAELIDGTVETVRKITQELRPGILDDFGLLAAVEWQLQEFQKRYGIECQLFKDGDELSLDSESATAIFRVFQETLSNVARHANATRVEVTVEQHDHYLVLQVEDNGRGISDRELFGPNSLGLLGMRERIHLLAGEIDIRGLPHEGTLVLVKVPLPDPDGARKETVAGPSGSNGNNGATVAERHS